MILSLFQVFYQDGQVLDAEAIPVDGRDVDHGGLYENYHISRLPDYINLSGRGETEYVGLTSWRMKEKTGLTKAELEAKITEINTRSDVPKQVFAYYPSKKYVANIGGPQVSPAIKKALLRLSKLGLFEYRCLLTWRPVMSNYWIIKKELLGSYVTFLDRAIKNMETDPELVELCNDTLLHRGKQYVIKPFILEYLFGLWLAGNTAMSVEDIS